MLCWTKVKLISWILNPQISISIPKTYSLSESQNKSEVHPTPVDNKYFYFSSSLCKQNYINKSINIDI